MNPDLEKELRVNNSKLCVSKNDSALDPKGFEQFSDWRKLKTGSSCLQHIAESCHNGKCHSKGWHQRCTDMASLSKAEYLIIISVQRAAFSEETYNLQNGKPVPRNSSLIKLNPFMDSKGILRVSGRLSHLDVDRKEKHPVIIPKALSRTFSETQRTPFYRRDFAFKWFLDCGCQTHSSKHFK